MITRLVVCLFTGLLSFSSLKAEPLVNIEMKTDAYSEADVKKAMEIFWDNCKPLSTIYFTDIVSVSLTASDEFTQYRMNRGWKHSIHLAIKMSDNPVKMPASDNEIGVMAGHTLHYDLGGGQDSGFFASKRVSQKVCGLKARNDGVDAFRKIRAFDFLKE
ncbi:hypothetical protein [Agrobacterium tumefaciens]|uniref:hypothetical protein n=1 Tax=Agrobacterium tumefaciens TaxID=358 RepID=UPI0015741326|nr:hypothetical protein [Agrobacterium tumefaciens]WCJ63098.1 hypothetical protein G6M15_02520 [Agrobacterium tumefaciens]